MSQRLWKYTLAIAGLLMSVASAAQNYPARPIRVIVPYATGGADVFMRLIAPKLSEQLGQPVVIDNRPGANGVIGTSEAMRAAPNGYVLLFGPVSATIGARFLMKNVPYDTARDFTMISTVHESPMVITAHPSIPAKTVQELINYARQNPGKLSYGSVGGGSVMHLNAESFLRATHTEMLHVPYNGLGQMLIDSVAGRVPIGFSTLASTIGHVQAGKLRAIAVLEPRTVGALPGVPSVNATLPNFRKPAAWSGIFGPAGLDPTIQMKLSELTRKVLALPEIRVAFEQNHGLVLGSTPKEMSDLLATETDLTAKIIRDVGIQPE